MNAPAPAPNHYEDELTQLGESYAAACAADIESLKLAIASAAECSLIGVGSGGSFTVASLLCGLHETYTGRVSRPSTPLEIICSPALASSSPVFLVSAEGNNPDIVEALERSRRFSSRPVHVLTNRQDSKLMTHVGKLPGVKPYVFELTKKDGYLATNSLLLDAVLVARAYAELNGRPNPMPASISALQIGERGIAQWLKDAQPFLAEAVRRGALTVVYSPLLKPIATDLESKLSEGALLHVQLADLRSYAHGRHLWLAQRPDDCAILALIEPTLAKLWVGMRSQFPEGIPTFDMALGGSEPVHLIAGLVAQMHMVVAVGRLMGKDPGRPNVPTYGRAIHYTQVGELIPLPSSDAPAEESAKYEVLGAHWPSRRDHGEMRRAAQTFILARGVSKSALVAAIIQQDSVDPYQILTMGDQGAWPGNDAALLEHRYSLSVDLPSRRLDRGWKLAPTEKRDVDATLWYLEHMTAKNGLVRVELPLNDGHGRAHDA